MLVILVHHANASFPSEVTDDGIVSELNLQLKNASFPIVVTPEGIVTGGRLVQPRKASSSMVVTIVGIVMPASLAQPLKKDPGMVVMLMPGPKVAEARLLQLQNTLVPMDVTLAGIVIDDSEVQS